MIWEKCWEKLAAGGYGGGKGPNSEVKTLGSVDDDGVSKGIFPAMIAIDWQALGGEDFSSAQGSH